jgi:putative ABC transport system substrate-binding protein
MKRRTFIAGLGSAAVWPVAAQAQQRERMRRIGVLMALNENDPAAKTYVSAFTQALAELGWTDGRNVRMDLRSTGGDINRIRVLAQELVGLQPDIIVASGNLATIAVQRETRTIPIVFAAATDPVARGLLSDIAPGLKRAAIMFISDTGFASTYKPSLEAAARSLKVELITAPVRSDVEIETAIIALGHEPGGGLVVIPAGFLSTHRASVIFAAARNNVPAIYGSSDFAKDGGLLSYRADQVDSFRRAASYVDRILRGAKPGDLPVQFATKFELVINLKTAKALGLTIPETLLATADEVIQ